MDLMQYKFTCGICGFELGEKVRMMRHLEGHHYQDAIETTGQYKPPEEVEPVVVRPPKKQSLGPKLSRKASGKDVDPLVCEQCGKIFKGKSSLRLHYKAHSDTRDFVCHMCGNAYKARHNLEKHLRKFHPENPE